MANFKFDINQEAFELHGVRPVVDEALYEELIDENTDAAPHLEIEITPGLNWHDRSLKQRLQDIRNGDELFPPIGTYTSKASAIRLPARPDPIMTSLHLVHETKHYIDDVDGNSEESQQIVYNRLRGAVTLFGAGMIVGQLSNDRELQTDSVRNLFFSLPMNYISAPHEIAARQFAADPAIVEKYDRLIIYEQI